MVAAIVQGLSVISIHSLSDKTTSLKLGSMINHFCFVFFALFQEEGKGSYLLGVPEEWLQPH